MTSLRQLYLQGRYFSWDWDNLDMCLPRMLDANPKFIGYNVFVSSDASTFDSILTHHLRERELDSVRRILDTNLLNVNAQFYIQAGMATTHVREALFGGKWHLFSLLAMYSFLILSNNRRHLKVMVEHKSVDLRGIVHAGSYFYWFLVYGANKEFINFVFGTPWSRFRSMVPHSNSLFVHPGLRDGRPLFIELVKSTAFENAHNILVRPATFLSFA